MIRAIMNNIDFKGIHKDVKKIISKKGAKYLKTILTIIIFIGGLMIDPTISIWATILAIIIL